MPIDYSPTTQDGLSLIVQNYNLSVADPNKHLDDVNFEFDLPVVNTDIFYPGNTLLVARAKAQSNRYGVIKIYYERMDIYPILPFLGIRAPINTPISYCLAAINLKYNLSLVASDFVPVSTPTSAGDFTLQVSASSYLFIGSVPADYRVDGTISTYEGIIGVPTISWQPFPGYLNYNGNPANTALNIDISGVFAPTTTVSLTVDWVSALGVGLGVAPIVTIDPSNSFATVDFGTNAAIDNPGNATVTLVIDGIPNIGNDLYVLLDSDKNRISTANSILSSGPRYTLGTPLLVDYFTNATGSEIITSNTPAQQSVVPTGVWRDRSYGGDGGLQSVRLSAPSSGLTAKSTNALRMETLYLNDYSGVFPFGNYVSLFAEESITNSGYKVEWDFQVMSPYTGATPELFSLSIGEGLDATVSVTKALDGFVSVGMLPDPSGLNALTAPFVVGQVYSAKLVIDNGYQLLQCMGCNMTSQNVFLADINFSKIKIEAAKDVILKNIRIHSLPYSPVALPIPIYTGFYLSSSDGSDSADLGVSNTGVQVISRYAPHSSVGVASNMVRLGPVVNGSKTAVAPHYGYYPTPNAAALPSTTNVYDWVFSWSGAPDKIPTIIIVPATLSTPQRVDVTVNTYMDDSDISGVLSINTRSNFRDYSSDTKYVTVALNPSPSSNADWWLVSFSG